MHHLSNWRRRTRRRRFKLAASDLIGASELFIHGRARELAAARRASLSRNVRLRSVAANTIDQSSGKLSRRFAPSTRSRASLSPGGISSDYERFAGALTRRNRRSDPKVKLRHRFPHNRAQKRCVASRLRRCRRTFRRRVDFQKDFSERIVCARAARADRVIALA